MRTPLEYEIDGVKLSTLIPGSVKDVSSTLGLWLIAQGYARPEMRTGARRETTLRSSETKSKSHDYHHRRLVDRRKNRW